MNTSGDVDLDLSLSCMKDPDISLLVNQNQALATELAACKADKDFVWSLWKKLQVANPDVTEAISLVVQREKEKSENKDRKVLEIIQVKDDRIEELQDIVTKQAEEISDALSKKVELTEKNSRFQAEIDQLQSKVRTLEIQIRGEENKERSLEDHFRRTVEGTEKEKYELSRKVNRLTTDLEVAKSEKAHALNRQKILEERVRTLEREVSEKMVKFEELVKEVEDSSSRLTRYESQTSQQRRDLEFKNQELENVRKELKELWLAHNQLTEHSGQQADLIRQLQNLQQDTQKMMKNQEDAFTLESTSLQHMFTDVNVRYETAKKTEAELRQQVLELKKNLMEKDDIISSLHSQDTAVVNNHNHSQGTAQHDYSSSFLDIVQEVDAITTLNGPPRSPRGRSLGREPYSTSARGGSGGSRLAADFRSRSLSPPTRDGEPQDRELGDVRRLADLQKELSLKDRQLTQLRKAHDNRLHRYQNLQASYKLAREEIKNTECGRTPKSKKPKRADPRSLQRENSDQVWNELSYFKSENRTLQVDKMSLQEEVDLLRVQTSQDAATIHELKVAAQGHREEYEFQLRRLSRESKGVRETDKQLSILKSQVQNKTVHIEKLERDMVNLSDQRDDLMQEKSKLMSQLVSVQQESSNYRMELADVKHQLQSAKHQLEELMQTSNSCEEAPKKSDADIVVRVAANLRGKRPKISNMYKSRNVPRRKRYGSETLTEDCEESNEDGWEEIESSDCETESDGSSLGIKIASKSGSGSLPRSVTHVDKSNTKAKSRRVPTHRPPVHTKQSAQSDDVSARSNRSSRCSQRLDSSSERVSRREFATSPIAFLSASCNTVRSSSPPPPPQHTSVPQTASNVDEAGRRCGTTNVRNVSAATRARKVTDLAHLRQRVPHLQQQVAVLKKAKAAAIKSQDELKNLLLKAQTELSSITGRLTAAKQHVQTLQAENEKLQSAAATTNSTSNNFHKPEIKDDGDIQEIKVLEAKLKVANSEASRQSAALRTLKTDNESLQDQIRNLQDKLNHLERDVNQKRNLLESQRIKLKHAQDVSKNEVNNMEELQTKVKLLTESSNKSKVQMDSLKKRLTLAMKEKKEYEERFLKCSLESDHKGKQLLEANARRAGLETALTELEGSAQQQLHGLATQSEAAIDSAREKLTAAQTRLAQFHSMVKVLCKELVGRSERARNKMREAKAEQGRCQREGDPALQRAADKAKDILNLSSSDLDDILSADGDGRENEDSICGDDKKADKRWLRKCEKLMNSREDFVHALTSLMLQKMDERADILIKLPR